METVKLYEIDSCRTSCQSHVLRCTPCKRGFQVVLDQTVFYPEGGGQPGDTGRLGGVTVQDTFYQGDEIIHLTDGPLEEGSQVEGRIQWDRRLSFMRLHTGEHLFCGVAHRLWGKENTGFHMNGREVTFDLTGEMTKEQVSQAERQVNLALMEDGPVTAFYPTQEQLETLDYRSKGEMEGPVRLVQVGDYDLCACCGLHVPRTGMVGCFKVMDAQRHRGNTRITAICGADAFEDYQDKHQKAAAIGAQLSIKPEEIADGVQRLQKELAEQKQTIAHLQKELLQQKAQTAPLKDGLAFWEEEGLSAPLVREMAMALCKRAKKALVLSPNGQGWMFTLGSQEEDIRPLWEKLKQELQGRGGGSAACVQGTLQGEKEQIASLFERLGKE